MNAKNSTVLLAGLVLAASAVGGVAVAGGGEQAGPRSGGEACRDLPRGSEAVHLDPADFTTRIDNAYWPMRPGTVWHLVETAGSETQHTTIRVTHRTKLIAGVRARVVHDVVRAGGEVVEDTRDWYAQDSDGALWYLGERTRAVQDDGSISTEGSWQHGRQGAYAGVALPGRPRPGCTYREEYRPGVAQDRATVLGLSEAAEVPAGFFRGLLHTANQTALEPHLLENKLYARGVGPVLEVDLSPSFSRAVLVRVDRP